VQEIRWSRARFRTVPWLMLSLVVLFAAVIAACGSSDSTSTPTAPGATSAPGGNGGDPTAAPEGAGGTLRIGMTAGNVPFPNTPPNEGFEGRRFVGKQIYDGALQLRHVSGRRGARADARARRVRTSSRRMSSRGRSSFVRTWSSTTARRSTRRPWSSSSIASATRLRVLRRHAGCFEREQPRHDRLVGVDRRVPDVDHDGAGERVATVRPRVHLLPEPRSGDGVGNDEYINHAAGTGPFRMTRYVDGQVMELEANEEYWGGRPEAGPARALPDA
jgi:peptide/nickel transport system substrate-binding protein